MKIRPFIILLAFLWGGFAAWAQVPEESSSASMPEQWQLTLDVIKSKAQTLVIENSGLQIAYRKLIEQAQELQQSVDNQQSKNEQVDRFLKERHGLTDQQVRIMALTQVIKTKNQQARTYDEQLANLKKKQYSIRDTEFEQEGEELGAKPSQNIQHYPVDAELTRLRKQLEDESTQEVLLENELGALKNSPSQPAKESSGTHLSQGDTRRYEQLKRRKEELEANIYTYESRLDELRQSSLTALSWPLKKKNLVHEMVLVDARNNKMRDQIKALSEDIGILRDQVAKLERRVDFIQGKDSKQ